MDDVDPPPLEFLICCSISQRFCLQWKAFDLLYNIIIINLYSGCLHFTYVFYKRFLMKRNKKMNIHVNKWVVGLPVVCDVTKHGRHLVCHLGFYQELEIK